MIFEICTAALESALAAQNAGANRVELCSALSLGGVTPSAGLIFAVQERLEIDVNVLIRPRQGDFLYSNSEFCVMMEDIKFCAKAGANGVVIGILDKYGDVDILRTKQLVNIARDLGLSVTFHRAIDRSRDILRALEDIISLGIDRVLTSGGMSSALEGKDIIKKMNEVANRNIIIMPGAGINASNIKELIDFSGVEEIHFSGSENKDTGVRYREGISFTPQSLGGDYIITESNLDRIISTISSAI